MKLDEKEESGVEYQDFNQSFLKAETTPSKQFSKSNTHKACYIIEHKGLQKPPLPPLPDFIFGLVGGGDAFNWIFSQQSSTAPQFQVLKSLFSPNI